MDEFDPTLTRRDIMEMFNCSPHEARKFMMVYGVKTKTGRYLIGLHTVRRLQLSGDAAEFFSKPRRFEKQEDET